MPWVQKHHKEVIFILLGIIFLYTYSHLISTQTLEFKKLLAQIMLNLGIILISIGVISFIWEGLGGEPAINAIKLMNNFKELGDLGIKRITLRDDNYKFGIWKKSVEDAQELYFMGNILRDWLTKSSSGFDPDYSVIEILKNKLETNNCKNIKILILDPNGKSLRMRAFDEMKLPSNSEINREELEKKQNIEFDRMQSDINGVVEDLKELKRYDQNNCLKVRLVDKTYINSSILIFDETMVAINYLHKTGNSGTPIIEIKGKDKKFYLKYHDEFYRVWRVSKELNFDL